MLPKMQRVQVQVAEKDLNDAARAGLVATASELIACTGLTTKLMQTGDGDSGRVSVENNGRTINGFVLALLDGESSIAIHACNVSSQDVLVTTMSMLNSLRNQLGDDVEFARAMATLVREVMKDLKGASCMVMTSDDMPNEGHVCSTIKH